MIRLALAAFFLAAPLCAAELKFRGTYHWVHDHKDFGGLSAIWMASNGSHLTAISDSGFFIDAKVTRKNGVIQKLDIIRLAEIAKRPVEKIRRSLRDAEGITVTPDGVIYVSYEGTSRIWKFQDLESTPQWAHEIDYFYGLQNNSGLEALASDADGNLYAIPERSGVLTRPFPVFRRKGETWDKTLSIPRSKQFLVVGADFGPDGLLYVLERDASFLTGFKTRIRRFALTKNGFDSGETIYETAGGSLLNTEGISLWTDRDGQIVVSIIADDNFKPILPTAVLEFDLVE